MFISEAAFAAQLAHPNIVHVFDFGQLEGRYFIAMEYVPGVTLRIAHKRMVARGERLPVDDGAARDDGRVRRARARARARPTRAARWGSCTGTSAPTTSSSRPAARAKLIDFGAARATARTPPTPVFVGKYRYAAPERIRRVGEDRRSDVYSAGVILYECLAGRRPFDGTDIEVIEAVLASRGCDPRGARARRAGRASPRSVMKATAQDPADRFASARELRRGAGARASRSSGAGSKERDVTAALAALLEAPAGPRGRSRVAPAAEAEAVPEPIGVAGPRGDASATDLVRRRDRAVRGGDPRGVGANPQAGRAAAPLQARGSPGARAPTSSRAACRPVVDLSAPAAPSARRARLAADVAGAFARGRALARASAPSSSSIAASSCAARAATARRSTRGRRRWRSRPTTASTRRTSSGCAASSSRVRAEAPVIDVLSALRVDAPVAGRRCGRRALPPVAAGGVRHDVRRRRRSRPRAPRAKGSAARWGWPTLDDLIALCQRSSSGVVEVAAAGRIERPRRSCASASPARALTSRARRCATSRAGWSAGAISSIFGRPVRVRETACHGGRGDDACRFEIDFV